MKLENLETELGKIRNFTRKDILEKAEYCIFRCSGNPYEHDKDVHKIIRRFGRRKTDIYALKGMYDDCVLNRSNIV